MYKLSNFDPDDFLAHYWQQRPALFRQVLTDFIDPLDEHELASLAQDPHIDSRIVAFNQQQWHVTHGPFEEFTVSCQGAWSLLVQAVDQHVPGADSLMRAFSFIPYWRMDDLMVSFANRGGGVGPHLDQYDVFIIQGKGSRRWQVGEKGNYEEHYPHADLRQINGFAPIIDEILHPGDMLYIPPGYPHNGTAVEDCMTYSVGFRAPSQQELLSSFADYSIDQGVFIQRHQDNGLKVRPSPGQINRDEVASFKALLSQTLDTPHFANWLADYFSHTQLNQGYDEMHNPDYSVDEISQLFDLKTVFERQMGIRPVYVEPTCEEDGLDIYIEGNHFAVPCEHVSSVKHLIESEHWQYSVTANQDLCFWTHLIMALVNTGAWLPQE